MAEGPREVIWGVNSPEALDEIEAELRPDRAVSRDETNTVRTTDPNGIAIGFRVFDRTPFGGQEPIENSIANPKDGAAGRVLGAVLRTSFFAPTIAPQATTIRLSQTM